MFPFARILLGISFQLDAVSIGYRPVKDGICQGGVGDVPVLLGNRDLCRDQGGGVVKAVIEDSENVLCILDGEGTVAPDLA